MACEITHEVGSELVHVRISKRMAVSDQKALESVAKRLIDDDHPVRVLITLVDFEGWETDAGWEEDLEFSFNYANNIESIAVVGDEQWRQQALLFVGDGFRKTRIRYFPPTAYELAEQWVKLP